jgi:two-component system LytT family response regulator
LKPFDEERFRKTVERAKRRINEPKSGHDEQILEFIREWKNRPKYLEKLAASSEGRICLLPVERIDCIEAKGNYIRIHSGKMAYLIRETVQSIESQLDPSKFLRIHRSIIVNIDRIREIQQMFHGSYRVVLTDGRWFNLSRKYKDRLPRIAKRETE